MDRFQLTVIDAALNSKTNDIKVTQLLSFWNTIKEANLKTFEEYLYVKKIHERLSSVKHDAYDAKRVVELSKKIGEYYTKGNVR